MERNRLAVIVRLYPGAMLLLLLPLLLATELALVVVAVAGGWLPQKLRADAQWLRWLPRLLSERRALRTQRAIGAGEFSRCFTARLSSPFLGPVARIAPLQWALAGYWAVVRLLLGGGGRR
jgi:hypothetical protein